MVLRETFNMDLNPKIASQLKELHDIGTENNFKIFKVALFRAGLTMLYEQVMDSENKGATLNNLVMRYDNKE